MKLSTAPSQIGSIDSAVEVAVERDETVEKSVRLYAASLHKVKNITTYRETFAYYSREGRELAPLAPVQIDLVLQRLLPLVQEDPAHLNEISIYLSWFLDKSCKSGHAEFTLHTQNVPLNFLCAHLKGTQESPVNVAIFGNTGHITGAQAKWCRFEHQGNGGESYLCASSSC